MAEVYTDQPPEEYTYEDFLADAALVSVGLVAALGPLANPFRVPGLSPQAWVDFLALIYPFVDDARRQISESARKFYDWERFQHYGPVEIDGQTMYPRSQVDLDNYFFDWFVEDMEEGRKNFVKENASEDNLATVLSLADKQAEMGGRRTILRAVDDDPQVVGWARVEGTENVGSCGFCAMLISRGPVYKESDYAGLDTDDKVEAVEIYRRAEESGDDSELMALMNRWHPNCDCKVVPVFDRRNWKGRDEYLRYEQLWVKHTKGLNGKDAVRAFRKAIESGYDEHHDAPAVLRPVA